MDGDCWNVTETLMRAGPVGWATRVMTWFQQGSTPWARTTWGGSVSDTLRIGSVVNSTPPHHTSQALRESVSGSAGGVGSTPTARILHVLHQKLSGRASSPRAGRRGGSTPRWCVPMMPIPDLVALVGASK